jgi:predicted ATPase
MCRRAVYETGRILTPSSCFTESGQEPRLPRIPHEAWLQRALAVARRQEATALELRAAMSLSRLWQQQVKWEETRALLAPVYGWFTEGFNTADLQEAKALLDELGR